MTKNLQPQNAAIPVGNKQINRLMRDSVDMSPHLHASHSMSDLTNLEDSPKLPFNDSLEVLFAAEVPTT